MSVDSFLSFAKDFGLVIDADRYRVLATRNGTDFRVAVIGLVSRGKSTLVNRLTGLELCPVDARAETIANVFISAGPSRARAFLEIGTEVPISTNPSDFAGRLPRRVEPPVKRAEFVGTTRLPAGVTLVDTPGIGDADIDSLEFGELDAKWTETGAIAAVIVLSYPPGFARSDRRLLDTAHRVFGRSLIVALKATDSQVEEEDLQMVASEVEAHTGMRPVVLLDSAGDGPWGSGPLAELELATVSLRESAERARADDMAELEDIHRLAVLAVRRQPLDALERLANFDSSYPGLSDDLRTAVLARAAELRELERQVQAAELAAERAKRARFLDAQAEDLLRVVPSGTQSSGEVRSQGRIFGELLQLAAEGSETARAGLAKQLPWALEQRQRVGIELSGFIKTTSPSVWLPIIENLALEPAEALSIVESLANELQSAQRQFVAGETSITALAGSGEDFLRACVPILQKHCWRAYVSAPSIRAMIGRCGNRVEVSELQLALEREYRAKILRDLREQINSCNTTAQLRPLVDEIAVAEAVLSSGSIGAPRTDADRSSYESECRRLCEVGRQRVVWVLQALENDLRSRSRDITVEEVERHVQQCHGAANWAALSSDTASVRLAGLFAPMGGLVDWARRCRTAQAMALAEAERVNSRSKSAYTASFVLWGLSLLMLGPDVPVLRGIAVFVWLTSFITWLAARRRVKSPVQWLDVFIEPEPPHVGDSTR